MIGFNSDGAPAAVGQRSADEAGSETCGHPPVGVRQALVARVRAELRAGALDTADRLDAAVERLLDEVMAKHGAAA